MFAIGGKSGRFSYSTLTFYWTDVVLYRLCVPARPAARQSFSYKWRAAGWGGIVYVMFEWTACAHFRDSFQSSLFAVIFLLSFPVAGDGGGAIFNDSRKHGLTSYSYTIHASKPTAKFSITCSLDFTAIYIRCKHSSSANS
jgi:hypothetical protein